MPVGTEVSILRHIVVGVAVPGFATSANAVWVA
jgi:hypothetical protein